MITTNDFKKGLRYEEDKSPWQILEFTVHNPSARGAATLVKSKVRNLLTGQVLLKTYKAGDTFGEPDLKTLQAQYLYAEAEDLVFMDTETYDQYTIPSTLLGDAKAWLTDGFQVKLLQYNGVIINAELPQSVEARISALESAARGDTASGKVMAKAYLENGLIIPVPSFIKEGETIKVDPDTNTYLGRA